jgi:antitoxin component YwqK of YwqJK toxin-antitoxin module
MHITNSYRAQVFLLLATIAIGIYILISISSSPESFGSATNSDGLIVKQLTNEPFSGIVTDTIANKIITYEVKNGLKHGDLTISYLNGKKAITGKMLDNKNNGKWYYYYPSGKLESEGFFKNDIVVDNWTWYYQNGNKMEEGCFSNGKRDGIWKLYNEDGDLKKSIIYNNGNVISTFDSGSSKSS